MSRYTAELRTLIDNDIDIFDFEYTRTPASKAIISDEALEQGFIDHFYFNEVGFETVERFKHFLKVKWLENLQEFDSLLVEYNKPINVKSNSKTVSVFNDTPKSKLPNKDFATSLTEFEGYNGLTEIEMLDRYHELIRDIQVDFYEKFNDLFMQIF